MEYSTSFNGWFGEIADTVTYDRIDELALQLFQYYQKHSTSGQKLVIGYDSRLFSKKFAEYFAVLMADYGLKVFISNKIVPSSVLVVSSLHKKSMGAICVTGDEHESNYIGFRAYNDEGYLLNDDDLPMYDSKKRKKVQDKSIRKWITKGFVEPFDPSIAYTNYIQKHIDFSSMIPSLNRILFNPLFGSGIYYFDRILKHQGIRGYSIDFEESSDFNRIEPLPSSHCEDLYTHMVYQGAELGFIVSPDCSQFEFMFGPHRLSLQETLYFLAENFLGKGINGTILVSSSLSINLSIFNHIGFDVVSVSPESFQEELRDKEVVIAVDEFSRFYFQDHGAADALLVGYYLLETFNNKTLTPAKLEHKINTVREMIK